MSLYDLIAARIASEGPISLADYMAECLLHPTFGYYATRDPLGTDFVTAPEISQVFGELLGLTLAQAWMNQGSPAKIVLAEAGPGRGTLMQDALRATRQVPGFHDAIEVVLVEASPVLQDIQKRTIDLATPRWVASLDELPDAPLFFVANEFFDALPIRQFQRDGQRWRERQIGLKGDKLVWGLGPAQPQPALKDRLEDTSGGDLVEYAPSLAPAARAIGGRVQRHGGAALIVDYGDWRSLGDTLQALRGGTSADPLESPGTADLTAHVDFEALAHATPSRFTRLTPQGVFLERLGITQRAQALAQGIHGSALDNLIAAHRRLTHPAEMGNLFKVLGFYPTTAKPPPGLDA